jgi:hypothetical protein
VFSHGAFQRHGLFALSGSFAGIGRRSERRDGHGSFYLALVGFGFLLLAITFGHLSLLLHRLTIGARPYSFHGMPGGR